MSNVTDAANMSNVTANLSNVTAAAVTVTTTTMGEDLGFAGFGAVVLPALLVGLFMCLCFCCCRKRLPEVYEPRLERAMPEVERKSEPAGEGCCLGWLRPLCGLGLEELAHNAGVDAAARVVFHLAMLAIFFVLSAASCGALLYLYATGENGHKEFAMLTLRNTSEVWRLWTASGICAGTSVLIYLIVYLALKKVARLKHKEDMRLCHFRHLMVLARDIPLVGRTEEAIAQIFEDQFQEEVLYVRIVKDLGKKHEKHVVQYTKLWRKLKRAEWKQQEDPIKVEKTRDGCCGKKVETVALFKKRCQRKHKEIETRCKEWENIFPSSHAFIAFKNFTTVADVLACKDYKKYRLAPAPDPREIIWPAMWKGRMRRFRLVLAVLNWLVVMFIIFIFIPFTALAVSLVDLEALADKFVFLEWIRKIPEVVLSFLRGLLPVIVVAVINALVAPVFRWLANRSGVEDVKSAEKKLMWYYFWFLTIDSFLVIVIGGSLFEEAENMWDAFNDRDFGIMVDVLGDSLPMVSTFFIIFVVGTALAGAPAKLANLGKLVVSKFVLTCFAQTDFEREEVLDPGFCPFAINYALDVYVFLLSVSYATVAPLMTLAGFLYFLLNFISTKYMLNHVWRTAYTGGGFMVVSAFRAALIGLMLGQLVVFCAIVLIDRFETFVWIPVVPCIAFSFVGAVALPLVGPGRRVARQDLPPRAAAELQDNPCSDDALMKCQEAGDGLLWAQPSFSVDWEEPLPWRRFNWEEVDRQGKVIQVASV